MCSTERSQADRFLEEIPFYRAGKWVAQDAGVGDEGCWGGHSACVRNLRGQAQKGQSAQLGCSKLTSKLSSVD